MPYADADLYSIDNFITDDDNRITIEEIEQTTLERETTNREYRTDFKENDPNITNTEVRDESKGRYLTFRKFFLPCFLKIQYRTNNIFL